MTKPLLASLAATAAVACGLVYLQWAGVSGRNASPTGSSLSQEQQALIRSCLRERSLLTALPLYGQYELCEIVIVPHQIANSFEHDPTACLLCLHSRVIDGDDIEALKAACFTECLVSGDDAGMPLARIIGERSTSDSQALSHSERAKLIADNEKVVRCYVGGRQ